MDNLNTTETTYFSLFKALFPAEEGFSHAYDYYSKAMGWLTAHRAKHMGQF